MYLAAPPPATATPVDYTLSGVSATFGPGLTDAITGTFTYDPSAQTLNSVDLTVTGALQPGSYNIIIPNNYGTEFVTTGEIAAYTPTGAAIVIAFVAALGNSTAPDPVCGVGYQATSTGALTSTQGVTGEAVPTTPTSPSLYVSVSPGGNPSSDVPPRPTSMTATATISTTPVPNSIPVLTLLVGVQTLGQAASDLGYLGFDWVQTLEEVPCPINVFARADPSVPYCGDDLPDPPAGGYTWQTPQDAENSYPSFFYNPASLLPIEENNNFLNFMDTPSNGCLRTFNCGLIPASGEMVIDTELVPVLSGGEPGTYIDGAPLFTFDWESDFNGTTGGVVRLNNPDLADPGSGTGGVTLLSINGVPVNGVPEPPTILLLATSVLTVALFVHRARL